MVGGGVWPSYNRRRRRHSTKTARVCELGSIWFLRKIDTTSLLRRRQPHFDEIWRTDAE